MRLRNPGIARVDLRQAGEPGAGERHLEHAADIRQTGREADEPERVGDFPSAERTRNRIVVIGVAEARFVDEARANQARVRQRERLVLTELIAHPECGQVALPHRVGGLVHRHPGEHAIDVREVVVDAGRSVVRLLRSTGMVWRKLLARSTVGSPVFGSG